MNLYRDLIDLLQQDRLDIGTVSALRPDGATVSLAGGGTINARSAAQLTIGDVVFVRGDVIESTAQARSIVDIEV